MRKISKDFIKFRQHIRTLSLSVNEQYLLELFFEYHNCDYGYCFLKVDDILKAFNTTSKNRVISIIKKLEKKGLIVVDRSSKNNRYKLTFIDKFVSNKETKTPAKAEKKAPKEEVEAVKEVAATKKEETKEEETSIEDELVEETGRDKETVKTAIKEAVKRGANNVKAYAKVVIENTKQVKETFTPTGFSNFTGRNYTSDDYKNLEKALLGW